MLQQVGDFVLRAPAQELTPIFTREMQPSSEIVTALGTEPQRVVLTLLDLHALPTVPTVP